MPRELLLLKMQFAADRLDAIGALLLRTGAKVLSPDPSSYIVELAGTELEIGKFIAEVGGFGRIIEVVRGGVLGIARARLPAIKAS